MIRALLARFDRPRRRVRRRRSRRGITLMEVLVAVVVLLVMSVVVAESLRNSIEFNRLLNDRDVTTRAARVALSKLRRELQLAYLTPHRQAVNTFETLFVGQDDNPDSIYLTTLSHQRMYRDTRECDQTELTVWTESAPRDQGKGYILYHREAPRIDEEPDEDGVVYPLVYNVRSFNLRYLDPVVNEWKDEWDTRGADTPYRLPRAVEIGLVLIASDPDDSDRTIDVPFLSTVLLHYGDRLVNPNMPLMNALTGTGGAGGTAPGGAIGTATGGWGNAGGATPPTAAGGVPRSPAAGGATPWTGLGGTSRASGRSRAGKR